MLKFISGKKKSQRKETLIERWISFKELLTVSFHWTLENVFLCGSSDAQTHTHTHTGPGQAGGAGWRELQLTIAETTAKLHVSAEKHSLFHDLITNNKQ